MSSMHLTWRVLICVVFLCRFSVVEAARVTDLYSAQVPAVEGTSLNQSQRFEQALRDVLVKVTGRRSIVTDPAVMDRFEAAETYVQQHRTNPDGSLWVLFDQDVVRQVLDSIGQPVWGEERPVTLVWLVMDYGRGSREILAAESDIERTPGLFEASSAEEGATDRQDAVRKILNKTAEQRGLPLVLPIVDSEELDNVSISDVWGGFTESLVQISGRYGVDTILVGRARLPSLERAQVRWTLIFGKERFDWEGDIAAGPERMADFFASRFATSGSILGRMQLRVDGVDSLDDYGRLSRYLSSLDVIEDFSVNRIDGQTAIFSLRVRGNADRLKRSIALENVLRPRDDSLQTLPGSFPGKRIPEVSSDEKIDTVTSSLHYALTDRT